VSELQQEKQDLIKELTTSNELQLQLQRTIETLHVQLAGYGKEIDDLKSTVRELDTGRQIVVAKLEEEVSIEPFPCLCCCRNKTLKNWKSC
jgi:hypothetical protein